MFDLNYDWLFEKNDYGIVYINYEKKFNILV